MTGSAGIHYSDHLGLLVLAGAGSHTGQGSKGPGALAWEVEEWPASFEDWSAGQPWPRTQGRYMLCPSACPQGAPRLSPHTPSHSAAEEINHGEREGM